MRDSARCAAMQAAASEQTCIVIGVDADGTVRVGQFRNWGNLSVACAPRPRGWLEETLGAILDEAQADAQAAEALKAAG